MFATILAQIEFVNSKMDGFIQDTKDIREDVNLLKRERDISFGWIAGVSATVSVIVAAVIFLVQTYFRIKP